MTNPEGITPGNITLRWFVGFFLVAALGLAVRLYVIQQDEAERHEKMMRGIEKDRQTVREEKGGAASNMLFAEDYQEYHRSKNGR